MVISDSRPERSAVLDARDLGSLLEALQLRGYGPVGPTIVGDAVVLRPIAGVDELPSGVGDAQEPGSYRLAPRDDGRFFGHNLGPSSAKRFLFPPVRSLWTAIRIGPQVRIEANDDPPPKIALIGLRACDLAAIAIQDRVFGREPYVDPHYQAARENALLIAVNCSQAAATCFCASMGTGPRVGGGFDLCLTELLDAGGHRFLVEAGSEKGDQVLADLPTTVATERDRRAARAESDRAQAQIQRRLDTDGLKDVLYRNAEHPYWNTVGERCLACGNCTLVCPTCFCATVEDASDLTGDRTERTRIWDSCFNLEFSYIHGGSVRTSTAARYRQWITHKLGAWIEQFGTSGCVGCGRCIAWCPVGIDITEEAGRLRSEDRAPQPVGR
ncbi:MAG: 4Fe-4S dicluster domain-containing protein [Fimbriimonadaceae bacterium]|nr:4Fe-4S dicluster domain-containing protein [Fimbriimonadaceae bacterium]